MNTALRKQTGSGLLPLRIVRSAFCALFCLAIGHAAARSAPDYAVDTHNVLLNRLSKARLFAESGNAADPSGFEALRGKVVFLDVWAAWCESCRRSMPKVEEIYRGTRTQPGLGFLSVHDGRWELHDKTPRDVLAERGCDYPLYVDKQKEFTDSYDWISLVNSLPKYILIGKDGHIARRYGDDDLVHVQADMLRLLALPPGSTLTP